jgi:AGZA family xanthine/uracil permease-like MFS transporter
LLVIVALMARRVRGAIVLGILAAAVVAFIAGVAPPPEKVVSLPEAGSTFLELRPLSAIGVGFLQILFAFLFVDLFDTMGTLVAVGEQARLTDEQGKLPRVGRALQADAAGTVVGSLLGTSTVTSYVESAAGASEGGRTGLSNMVIVAGFTLCIFFSPIVGAIPGAATAPALIVVGGLMMRSVGRIPWGDLTESLPAFLTAVAIPLTSSITEGIAAGFITYAVAKGVSGRWKEVHPVLWVFVALFVLRYIYLHGVG